MVPLAAAWAGDGRVCLEGRRWDGRRERIEGGAWKEEVRWRRLDGGGQMEDNERGRIKEK